MSALQVITGSVLAVLILLASWRSLGNPASHGFYRFFGFSGTCYIIVVNIPYWFERPDTPLRVLAVVLLTLSLVFVLWGVYLLHRHGGRAKRENSPETLGFENTARLVTTGLYRYLRHPMYSSLLCLAWGSALKHPTGPTIAAGFCASVALFVTAKIEERENIAVFGEAYRDYMERSRMFVPFLF